MLLVVTIAMLWVPILLSAVLVFVAGSIIWMAMPWHRKDYRGLPDERAVADGLRRQAVEPGQYLIPYCPDRQSMKDPEYVKRMQEGPVAILTVGRPGGPGMGKSLALWFLYVLVVSIFVAYLASRTLAPGTEYIQVFRVAGTTAILAYSAAVIPGGIWFWRPWSSVWKNVIDGVIYGLLTAGTFGWLWPR